MSWKWHTQSGVGREQRKTWSKSETQQRSQLEEQRATDGAWEHTVKAHQDSALKDKLEQAAQFESKNFFKAIKKKLIMRTLLLQEESICEKYYVLYVDNS